MDNFEIDPELLRLRLDNAIAEKRYEEALQLTQEFHLEGNLLHQAVYKNDLELAEWALEKGVDIHLVYHGLTPFARACQVGEENLVRILLARDVSQVNEQSRGLGIWPGRTPLMFAAGAGSISIAELLLSCGADVNARDDLGFTPVMAAAEAGRDQMIEYLRSQGADVTATDDDGTGNLEYAVQSGNVAPVALLLSYGLAVNRPDPSNRSIPLWTAIIRKNTEMVEFLLSHGADPLWRSSFGEDALGLAKRCGSRPQILVLLTDCTGRA